MGTGIVRSSHNKLYLLFICLTCLSGKFLCAQEFEVQGNVTDTLNNPISGLNVLVHPTNSKDIIAFASTNNEGFYRLVIRDREEADISFRGIAYESKRVHVSNKKNSLNSIRKDVVLQSRNEQLEEVIIEAERSITVKKDTIIIKASAFRKGNEEVLEDLLANIPGLEVDANGDIKAGNQGIEKIMVEGDDFFGRGYKLLSKNMDHQGIENVEIYQHYSENKLLKDVVNSNKVALNLTLRDDYKAKWFGNISGGYNTLLENRHIGKLNLMSFGKKNKFYFLSAMNNLGLDDSGDLDDLINSTDQESISGTDNLQTNTYFDTQEQLQYLGAHRTRFNNSKLISLNSILNLTDDLKIKLLAFSNWDRIGFYKNSIQRYRLNQIEFTNNQQKESLKNLADFLGKSEVIYDFGDNASLKLFSTINSRNSITDASILFNNDAFNTSIEDDNVFINQSMNFTQKFKDSLVLDVRSRYINDNRPQSYITNSQLTRHWFGDSSADTISQNLQNDLQFYGIETNLLKRFENRDLMVLKMGFTSSKQDLNSILGGVSTSSETNFENNFSYKNRFLFITPEYSSAFKQFNLSGSLSVRKYFNDLTSSINDSNKNNLLVWNPTLGLSWEKKNHNISAQYSYTNSPIEMPDIHPDFILKDFRSFDKGLGVPEFLGESNFFFNYTAGDWGDRFFARVFANYNKRDDYISTSSLITTNTEQVEKSIFRDQDILNINTSIDQFFDLLSSNIKLKAGWSRMNFENIVNTNLNQVETSNLNFGFEYKSAFLGNFNFYLGSEWFESNVSSAQDFSFSRNLSFLDLNYNLLEKLNFSLRSETYFFKDDYNSSKPYFFLDFDLRYTVKKNKFSIQLHGENMLNTKQFTDYFVTDVVNNQTAYRIIPRYLLLKFNYRF